MRPASTLFVRACRNSLSTAAKVAVLLAVAVPAQAIPPSRIFEPAPPPPKPDTRGIHPQLTAGMPGVQYDVLLRALGGMRGPAPSLVPYTESAPGYWNALGGLLRNKRGVRNNLSAHDESLGLSRADMDSTRQSSAPRARFSNLRVGDTVELRFSSGGCFGREGGVVRYDAAPGGGQIGWYDTARLSASHGLHQCGTQDASSARLTQLDAYLDYLRAGPEDRCSMTTEVTVTVYRAGTPIATESFRDSSCSVPRQAMDVRATFVELCGQ